MAEPYVSHTQIVSFADDVVNLHRDGVRQYREQVNRLRDRLAAHIADHPDYDLVKMLHSGSVAKGTALSDINDMDVAVYVRAERAPAKESELLDWLADRLREAYPQLQTEQIVPQTHCVRVSFRGSGLDVDVVPVVSIGEPDDRGYLVVKETGERVATSIPLHLEFVRKRKSSCPQHFAQLVRLVKWWVRQRKKESSSFRFKSFAVELLCAHLTDNGVIVSDYPRALEYFFAYVVKSGLKERIAFADYHPIPSSPAMSNEAIEILDPVNPENNVVRGYSTAERDVVVEAAHDALDSLNEAFHSTTKGRAVELWKQLLGPAFRG